MKRIITAVVMFLATAAVLRAQNEESYTVTEEVVGYTADVDTTLAGRDIFSSLPEGVTVKQSQAVRSALSGFISRNSAKSYTGYRIRIFMDSQRTAREASASAMNRFNSMYPDIPAYRTYSAPNFKVTVGNFRTKTEAEAIMAEIKGSFPDAFIVREKFKYPSIGTPRPSYQEVL